MYPSPYAPELGSGGIDVARLGELLLERPISKDDSKILSELLERFGPASLLPLLLNDDSSTGKATN
jgi:hypothetical protein